VPSPLALPDPSTVTLARSPLQLVVCQVRHDRNLAVADGNRVLAIREQLDSYPLMEEIAQQEVGIVLGPTGPASLSRGSDQRGWRLRSEDGAWTAALLPDFFALECTGYTSWTEFRGRMRALAEAVLTHLRPAVELRLGLRYVDRIEVPIVERLQDWSGYINEHLLGTVLDDQLGPALGSIEQAMQLQGPDGIQVLLRHGTQLDQKSGAWPYLLDTDCFRGDGRRLEADSLVNGADELHKLALQVFQASITPQLHDLLSGREES
jgi:uncharacterized protein (TIGR04255 family)